MGATTQKLIGHAVDLTPLNEKQNIINRITCKIKFLVVTVAVFSFSLACFEFFEARIMSTKMLLEYNLNLLTFTYSIYGETLNPKSRNCEILCVLQLCLH